MNDEKTELPSEHKKQKAAKEGNVGKSQEVVGFSALFLGLGTIFLLFPSVVERIKRIFSYTIELKFENFTIENMTNLALFIMQEGLIIVVPIFIILLIAAIASNVAQFGFLITLKTIIPKFSKLNAIKGIKNVISMKKLLDGLLITFKVLLALSISLLVFASFMRELPNIGLANLFTQLAWIKNKILILSGILLGLFALLAMVDFLIRRRQYINDLKMTKQEVKDEYKQLQGNPQIRARIRQTMRKMYSKNLLSNVSKASVVITNPTHYAVALKFIPYEDIAPIVVAKGTDLLAIRIKEIARKNNIPIREQKSLARELYRLVEIDDYIPEELFKAVSEIISSIEEITSQFNKKQNT